MKISVIIPTFNRSSTIERAIQSVLSQTYQDYELIVIDDGSTDESLNILKKYDGITVLTQENRGVSAARNLGVSKSSGKWLAFLDSDDEWLPHKLEEQVKFSKEHPNLNLVHGEEIWVRNGKRVNPKKKHRKSGGDIFERSLQLCLISPSAVMLTRELYDSHGGFNEDYIVCEDYDLWLSITSREEVGFIEDPIITKYGGHEDQLSAKYFAMDYWRIKSMSRFLDVDFLSIEKKILIAETMVNKGSVLITGYHKHKNFKDLHEIQMHVTSARKLIETLTRS